MAVEFDKALQAFAKVLDMSEADARIVIDNLNPAKQTTTFFTEVMQRLPIIKISKLRKTTMQYRRPLLRQQETRHLIGGRVAKARRAKAVTRCQHKN
jgi:hypothetical protein